MTTAPAPLLSSVAAHGLTNTRVGPRSTPLTDDEWPQFLAAVVEQRLTGFLVDAIADGSWPVHEHQQRDAYDAHADAAGLCLLLERELLHVASVLDGARINHRVLKGTAYAHLVYPDPALRAFGDVDVLVPSADFDAAVDLLVAAGGARNFPEPRPGFDRRFSKGASFVMPSGLEVDVHRTFVAGPFGLTIDTAALFQDGVPFPIGGRALMALSPSHQFLHACYHAALGNPVPRLLALRDVAQFLDGDTDVDAARREVREWDGEIVVARAIRCAAATLQLRPTPVIEWAETFVPSARERRRMRAYVGDRRSYAAQAISALGAIHGTRDRVAYLAGIILPRQARNPALTRWQRGIRVLMDRGRS